MSCSQSIRTCSRALLFGFLLVVSAIVAIPARAITATPMTGRGVYFYQLSGNPNGSIAIVGNTAAENQMVSNLKAWGINTVYGSYDSIISSNAAAVRSWNSLLASNGIASYVLLSSTTDFLSSYWSGADTWLWNDFLTFNENATGNQKFVGVMLDVEPEAFAGDANNLSWNATTNAGRRTYLGDLLTFVQAIRTLMNNESESGAPLATTLATWFPNLNQTVGWANQADVDSWFSSLGSEVNHVSLMDYGTDNVSLIESRYQANNALLPAGETTIALSSAIGAEWSSFSQMWSAMLTVESAESLYCDINSYDTLATDEE